MINRLILLFLLVLVVGCGADPVIEPLPTDEPLPTAEPTAEPEPTAAAAEPTAAPDPTEVPAEIETDGQGMSESTDPNEPSAELIEVLSALAPEGTEISATPPDRGHDENITYPFGNNPPPGGVHHPIWYQCGVYYAPLYTQAAIHAMEHGAVWITYNPDGIVGPAVTSLAAYASDQPFVLVSPFPEQESPVAVTAWGLQLLTEDVKDERIQQFIDAFANGPQNPEPGADCAQGITDTIDQ